jgi:hypothetical protein
MGLVDGIRKIVAQLLDDFLDPLKLFGGGQISNYTLEAIDSSAVSRRRGPQRLGRDVLEGADLSFVIELVVQGALDARIHLEVRLGPRSWSNSSARECCVPRAACDVLWARQGEARRGKAGQTGMKSRDWASSIGSDRACVRAWRPPERAHLPGPARDGWPDSPTAFRRACRMPPSAHTLPAAIRVMSRQLP